MPNRPIKIIVHHTASLSGPGNRQFDAVNRDHKARFGEGAKSRLGFYVGYQYFIEYDGALRQAREDSETGAHTIGQNNSSIGICLAGDFDRQMPSSAQVEALVKLLRQKTNEHGIPVSAIYPHRKFAQKSCYGSNLNDSWASNTLRSHLVGEVGRLKLLLQEILKKVGKP